jgi:hypothetical protein
MAMTKQVRYNVSTLNFPNARIEVYTRDDRLGRGVCFSLHTTKELMRFDLFNPFHEHWAVKKAERKYYNVDTFNEAVELALISLIHNHSLVASLNNQNLFLNIDENKLKKLILSKCKLL